MILQAKVRPNTQKKRLQIEIPNTRNAQHKPHINQERCKMKNKGIHKKVEKQGRQIKSQNHLEAHLYILHIHGNSKLLHASPCFQAPGLLPREQPMSFHGNTRHTLNRSLLSRRKVCRPSLWADLAKAD